MHIIHIFFSFKIGGAEILLKNIMNKQVQDNKVSLIIINNEIDEDLIKLLDPRIMVYRVNRKKKSKNLLPILLLNIIIIKIKPDIIHCHVMTIAKYIFVGLDRLVATHHAIGYFGYYWKKYQIIFAVSQSVFDDINSYGRFNSILAPNGILTDGIIKKKCYLENSFFRIVCVGRLNHEIKGQHLLIKAIYSLRKQGYSNFHVDFIGDGMSYSHLKDLTDKLSLSKCVNFLGNISSDILYTKLHTYDLFVLPSIKEAFGLSVIEAGVAGLPILISDVYGPMEIIQRGRYGYFFKTGDCESLAIKILKIYNNYDQAIMKSKEAHSYMIDNYQIDRTVDIYNESYTSLKRP